MTASRKYPANPSEKLETEAGAEELSGLGNVAANGAGTVAVY